MGSAHRRSTSFYLRGTVLTVDNGINAQSAVRLARRLGVGVIVIDHHRVQRRADTLAVWVEEFCGAGPAAASDPEAAQAAVAHLDRLNLLRRELVRDHFDQLWPQRARLRPRTPAAEFRSTS
jgi:hypothetical protein